MHALAKLLDEKDMEYVCRVCEGEMVISRILSNLAYMIETSKLVVHDPDSELESAFNFAGFLRRFSDTT